MENIREINKADITRSILQMRKLRARKISVTFESVHKVSEGLRTQVFRVLFGLAVGTMTSLRRGKVAAAN